MTSGMIYICLIACRLFGNSACTAYRALIRTVLYYTLGVLVFYCNRSCRLFAFRIFHKHSDMTYIALSFGTLLYTLFGMQCILASGEKSSFEIYIHRFFDWLSRTVCKEREAHRVYSCFGRNIQRFLVFQSRTVDIFLSQTLLPYPKSKVPGSCLSLSARTNDADSHPQKPGTLPNNIIELGNKKARQFIRPSISYISTFGLICQ